LRDHWLGAVKKSSRLCVEDTPSPLLKRISLLSYSLGAEEWELEETAEIYRLLSYVDEVTLETLQEIRSYLDIDYKALTLSPEGMGRVIAQVAWLK